MRKRRSFQFTLLPSIYKINIASFQKPLMWRYFQWAFLSCQLHLLSVFCVADLWFVDGANSSMNIHLIQVHLVRLLRGLWYKRFYWPYTSVIWICCWRSTLFTVARILYLYLRRSLLYDTLWKSVIYFTSSFGSLYCWILGVVQVFDHLGYQWIEAILSNTKYPALILYACKYGGWIASQPSIW